MKARGVKQDRKAQEERAASFGSRAAAIMRTRFGPEATVPDHAAGFAVIAARAAFLARPWLKEAR